MLSAGGGSSRPSRSLAPAVAVLLAATGCSAGRPVEGAARVPATTFTGFTPVPAVPGSTASVYIPEACPTPQATVPKPVWPRTLPANLPRPADATVEGSSVSAKGIAITQFQIPESLVTSVGTVLTDLKSAGYTLGRGDGEVAEADVPFIDADLRGTIRLVGIAACRTVWIVATAAGGKGNPYLLPHHNVGTASASPAAHLPFGLSTP